MSYVTPVMAITTAIISIAMDPWHEVRASHFFDSPDHILRSILLMLLGGALAFFMVWISTPSWEVQHLCQSILLTNHYICHAKSHFLFCWNQSIHCWFLLFHFFMHRESENTCNNQ
ncbi:unnamed protein product [Triticum turgidum subsp. durum]|uniref:Uncharacterized protein n=1 Tax=Triticum turgidum subsp. durum TaxID=4567 RepID=A0A9R0RPV7_TRITD|nr:unnamed protein product [Triticum turgidum subsp. durum]